MTRETKKELVERLFDSGKISKEERMKLLDEVPFIDQPLMIPLTLPLPGKDPYNATQVKWNMENCPCNPARGGSGVCGCILGVPVITCTSQE